jgi:hypothetical protein
VHHCCRLLLLGRATAMAQTCHRRRRQLLLPVVLRCWAPAVRVVLLLLLACCLQDVTNGQPHLQGDNHTAKTIQNT